MKSLFQLLLKLKSRYGRAYYIGKAGISRSFTTYALLPHCMAKVV